MVSWAVGSLLFSALVGAVFCDSPEVQVVENLIATSNKLLREHNRTQIALPDIGWIFEPVQYREGRLGQFDTLELLPNPKIVSRVNHYGTVYSFDLSTTLRNLAVTYKFHVNYPLFGTNGNVTIIPREKSFRLEGRVLLNHDGSCYAILQDAKVAQFGDFKVIFEPDDVPFIAQIYQAFLNVVNHSMIPFVNLAIRVEISRTSFREQFNKHVCDEVTRNSTTEAPTTLTPTTNQPQPSPSSSTPYYTSTQSPSSTSPDYTSTPSPSSTSPDYTSTPSPSSTSPDYTSTQSPSSSSPYYTSTQSPSSTSPYHTSTQSPSSTSPDYTSTQFPSSSSPYYTSTQSPSSSSPHYTSTQPPSSRSPYYTSTQSPTPRRHFYRSSPLSISE